MSKILSSLNHAASSRKRWWWLVVAAVYVLPFMIFSGFGAFDVFLKIEGIPGESVDGKHKDWIDVESFSFALKGASGGGGGTGKASFHDISLRKSIDKSSPILMLKCCTGEHFPEATLEYQKAIPPTGAQAVFLKIKMSDLLVSGYSFSGTGGGAVGGTTLPVDSLSLNFTKIEMTYIPYDAAGVPGSPVTAVCDLGGPTP